MFKDRYDAANELADKLIDYSGSNTVVIGIPRGGAVIASTIAEKLGCIWDLVIPKKIGAPHNSELAIGAVVQDGTVLLNEKLINRLAISKEYIEKEKEKQMKEIQRRLEVYRGNMSYPELEGKTVILVDDGIATGFTAKAALKSLNKQKPLKLILAVPVSPPETVYELQNFVDEVICVLKPETFYAVGQFYEDFSQTTDEEVICLFQKQHKSSLKRR